VLDRSVREADSSHRSRRAPPWSRSTAAPTAGLTPDRVRFCALHRTPNAEEKPCVATGRYW
jgi:hypothetical protein